MISIKRALRLICDILHNFLLSSQYEVVYIVEAMNWSIEWDGRYITQNLNQKKLVRSKISTTPLGLRNKIIHFGSLSSLISLNKIKKSHPSNKIVLTWFHINTQNPRTNFIKELNKKVALVHTSNNLTKNQLVKFGFDEEKIIVIPLGVDLNIFRPADEKEIKEIKTEIGLPDGKIIIGSFQKDGKGWGEGLEPKLIKGPDIFCEAVKKLAEKHPIHVLLTGPSRGYVKSKLKKYKIPFSHTYLKNYLDIVKFYQVLDLYMITSREEGGPKALLESMACNVPVVSTEVGMAPEMIEDHSNGMICNQEDIKCLFAKSEKVIMNTFLKEKISRQALNNIKDYSWEKIAEKYYEHIYKGLILTTPLKRSFINKNR